MQNDNSFLNNFDKRMKFVGRFFMLFANMNRDFYKNSGFTDTSEQTAVTFSIMLFIMEKSLREENCTIDDIASFLDELNSRYWHKEMSYSDCRNFSDAVVNDVLANKGVPMYFNCMDYKNDTVKEENINFIANRIIYDDSGIKRTSYYVTDDGYNLLLSTLEVESSMKFTIDEMIFKLQMERQNYEKAAGTIKELFRDIRRQAEKIKEEMLRIRRNAISYSIEDYDKLQNDDMETLRRSRHEFENYRTSVHNSRTELYEVSMNERNLTEKEISNLQNLEIIEDYLGRSLLEEQKVMNLHFDMKSLYDRELEALSQMKYIKRFSLRNDLYEKLLKEPAKLENIDIFLRPLFKKDPAKIYNPVLSATLQRPIKKQKDVDKEELLEFGDEETLEERLAREKERLERCRGILSGLFSEASGRKNGITLERIREDTLADEKLHEKIFPELSVFKEVIVSLVKAGSYSIEDLKSERERNISEKEDLTYNSGRMILELVETEYPNTAMFEMYKIDDSSSVLFENIPDEEGIMHSVRCSNALLRITEKKNGI